MTLEKAQRYAMGECLADYYHEYTYDQACKMIASPELNEDEDGDTIIFPCEDLEDADVVLVMDLMVNAYMEGAKNSLAESLADAWREVKQHDKERKDSMGMTCPDCTIRLPKAHPKILMPNQRCWCGYIDRRERP